MDKVQLDKLLIDLGQGDYSAFNEIYYMTSKSVFAVIYSVVKNQQQTEDLMQDTYVKLKKSIHLYKPGTNGLAWVLTISKNVALNEYKRRKREVFIDFNENPNQFGEYDIDMNETPMLDIAKKHLKESEYQILSLHLVSGLKHKEIAAQLDKPLGTVLWSYNNAIAKLKKLMNDQ